MKLSHLRRRIHSYLQPVTKKPAVSFIIRVVKELGEDNAGDMAASIAYYAILSIFPLLLGAIALLGYFLPSETVQAQIFDFSEQYIPGATHFIEDNIKSTIDLRGTLGVVSLIGLFWSGSAIFGAIGRAINRAWDIYTYRPYYLRKLRDFIMAICSGLLFFISMGLTALPSIIPAIDLPALDLLSIILIRLAGFILIFAVILLLYKFMPNTKVSWRYIWPGAALAAFSFEIARTVFFIYVNNYANYDKVYGSFAAFIVFLIWIYLSAYILIIGAEFTSEYGRLRRKST